jgi:hypothetical protein
VRELAYATTVYGAQGGTINTAHLLVGERTGAAAAYVGMTRGRERNVAHLVAGSLEEARRQWVDVFARDRADPNTTSPPTAHLLPAQARASASDLWRLEGSPTFSVSIALTALKRGKCGCSSYVRRGVAARARLRVESRRRRSGRPRRLAAGSPRGVLEGIARGSEQ